MHIAKSRIVPLIAVGAASVAIGATPVASAAAGATGVQVNQTTDNAQIVATPGAAAQQAAQLQEPFGGDMGALLFHYR